MKKSVLAMTMALGLMGAVASVDAAGRVAGSDMGMGLESQQTMTMAAATDNTMIDKQVTQGKKAKKKAAKKAKKKAAKNAARTDSGMMLK
ncbi:MAG: hypothetical protein HQM00_13085 [Magnetococcales bacterium]|nr:hypothetical protein [Magnetococcales bacterium]